MAEHPVRPAVMEQRNFFFQGIVKSHGGLMPLGTCGRLRSTWQRLLLGRLETTQLTTPGNEPSADGPDLRLSQGAPLRAGDINCGF